MNKDHKSGGFKDLNQAQWNKNWKNTKVDNTATTKSIPVLIPEEIAAIRKKNLFCNCDGTNVFGRM